MAIPWHKLHRVTLAEHPVGPYICGSSPGRTAPNQCMKVILIIRATHPLDLTGDAPSQAPGVLAT
eukprot:scaffold191112_cov16-Tisochrysis_lutea.AAC.1